MLGFKMFLLVAFAGKAIVEGFMTIKKESWSWGFLYIFDLLALTGVVIWMTE